MAIIPTPDFYYPPLPPNNNVLGSLNALTPFTSGCKNAVIFTIPRTGYIQGLGFTTGGTIASSHAMVIEFQTLDTSGVPSGNRYGGCSGVWVSGPVSASYYEQDLRVACSANAGDTVAMVFGFGSALNNGVVAIKGYQVAVANTSIPYMTAFSGGQWRGLVNRIPIVNIRYNDGGIDNIGSCTMVALDTSSYNSSSIISEIGIQIPVFGPMRANGFWSLVGSSGPIQYRLIGTDQSTNLMTVSISGFVTISTGAQAFTYNYIPFTSSIVLNPGNYIASIKPTNSSGITMPTFRFISGTLMTGMNYGSGMNSIYYCSGVGWSSDVLKVPMLGLSINGIDDGTGTGGGGMKGNLGRGVLQGGI